MLNWSTLVILLAMAIVSGFFIFAFVSLIKKIVKKVKSKNSVNKEDKEIKVKAKSNKKELVKVEKKAETKTVTASSKKTTRTKSSMFPYIVTMKVLLKNGQEGQKINEEYTDAEKFKNKLDYIRAYVTSESDTISTIKLNLKVSGAKSEKEYYITTQNGLKLFKEDIKSATTLVENDLENALK